MKKLLGLAVLCCIGVYSIAQSPKEERNKKVVVAVFKAMQKGDVDGAFKNYDKRILSSGNGSIVPRYVPLDSLKLAAVTNRAEWMKAFPDAQNKIVSVAADGDYVMLYTKSTGTWKNNFTIWQASGKSYQIADVTVYKLNSEGKITEVQRILPQVAIMNQIQEGGEFDLNKAGYDLLAQKKYNEAIEIFQLNVKLYPNSGNVYDSLGEAYMLAGDKKNAIENYEKSIKIDPENKNGKEMLVKLRQ